MTPHNWMKQRRELLGITQDQLGERLAERGLHVTKGAISKWEIGRSPLPLTTPENRRALAEALEMSISELLIHAGYEIGVEWSHSARLLVSIFETLPPADRRTLLALATMLKGEQETRSEIPTAGQQQQHKLS